MGMEKFMKRQIRQRRAARRGFTLMEVMLVLVIIAAIAGIAVVNIGGVRGEAFKRTAKADINNIKNMLSQYEMMVGTYPSTLDALYEQPSDLADPTKWVKISRDKIKPDPWQRPYEYKINGTEYEIRSLGPDGQSGTDDDIEG
jgi:general secretion pathway protein G